VQILRLAEPRLHSHSNTYTHPSIAHYRNSALHHYSPGSATRRSQLATTRQASGPLNLHLRRSCDLTTVALCTLSLPTRRSTSFTNTIPSTTAQQSIRHNAHYAQPVSQAGRERSADLGHRREDLQQCFRPTKVNRPGRKAGRRVQAQWYVAIARTVLLIALTDHLPCLEINDSGICLPPSPGEERKSFWGHTNSSRSTTSTSTTHRSLIKENEPFNISRESFDSYRRSFVRLSC
jgi:hypothetical protein